MSGRRQGCGSLPGASCSPPPQQPFQGMVRVVGGAEASGCRQLLLLLLFTILTHGWLQPPLPIWQLFGRILAGQGCPVHHLVLRGCSPVAKTGQGVTCTRPLGGPGRRGPLSSSLLPSLRFPIHQGYCRSSGHRCPQLVGQAEAISPPGSLTAGHCLA